jgi:acetolactate synthase-1/2/3 large subunit
MSAHVTRLESAAAIVPSVREAVAYSLAPSGGVVTLIAPSDLMEESVGPAVLRVPQTPSARVARPISPQKITEAASRLRSAGSAVILLGSDALSERGQRAALQIARTMGARLIMESYPAIVPLGGDLPRLERLAYFPDDVINQLGSSSCVLLAGARAPVSYFGYAGQPSVLVQDERLLELSSPGEDGASALEQLAEHLRGAASHRPTVVLTPPAPPEDSAELSPTAIAEVLVQQLPEQAIVSLEGSTAGGPYLQRAHRARRHRVMTNTGGAIGQGLPCAVGAAIAAPEARVVCLQSDGSAQYTLQALWTMAREALNVTVIICANHRYGILQTELRRSGAALDRSAISRLTRLDSPRVDWVMLAKGYGVPGLRATTTDEFREALAVALQAQGPCLIEAQLA